MSVIRLPPSTGSNRCSWRNRWNGPRTSSSMSWRGRLNAVIRLVSRHGKPKCHARRVTSSPRPSRSDAALRPIARSRESAIEARWPPPRVTDRRPRRVASQASLRTQTEPPRRHDHTSLASFPFVSWSVVLIVSISGILPAVAGVWTPD